MNSSDSCYLEHALSCDLEHLAQFPQYLRRSTLKKVPLSRISLIIPAKEFIHCREKF